MATKEAAAKKPLSKEQKKSLGWEIFWYVLFGIFWVTGLVLGIIGICAHNIGWLSYNPLYAAETSMTEWFNWGIRIDFRVFGAILIAIGSLGLIINIFYFANKYDKEKVRASRRKDRLEAIMAEDLNLDDLVQPGFRGQPTRQSNPSVQPVNIVAPAKKPVTTKASDAETSSGFTKTENEAKK